MDTTLDAALGGRLVLRQPAKGYRFAIDPILLAACCPARAGDRIADLGCGIGAAALAIAKARPGVLCHGIDKLPELVRLAQANAIANELGARATFNVGDVRRWRECLAAEAYDVVVANPPYLPKGMMSVSPDPIKAVSTEEDEGGLEAWISAACGCLRRSGAAIFIHRADRLAELVEKLTRSLGGVIVLPLHPRADAPARRIIMLARKGSRRPLQLLPGLVLHSEGGGWTEAARNILEQGQALDLEAAIETGDKGANRVAD